MAREIIDFHTHFYPPALAERARGALQAVLGCDAPVDGTRAGLLESMKQNGVSRSVGLPIANSVENIEGINRWAAEQQGDGICMFGSIHPAVSDPRPYLDEVVRLGLRGLKLHPEYQQFSLNDTALDALWQGCVERDLLVLIHAGRDFAYETPPRATPRLIRTLTDRFPRLRLVAAHLGAFQMWDEVEAHLVGQSLFFDLAFVAGYIAPEQVVRMIRAHGAHRVLFGSDSMFAAQGAAIDFLESLPLSAGEKELIFAGNARCLLA